MKVRIQIITPVAPCLDGRSLHTIARQLARQKIGLVPDSKASKMDPRTETPVREMPNASLHLLKCRQVTYLLGLSTRRAFRRERPGSAEPALLCPGGARASTDEMHVCSWLRSNPSASHSRASSSAVLPGSAARALAHTTNVSKMSRTNCLLAIRMQFDLLRLRI